MRLAKSHGLGNDYLVLESGEPLDAALVREICDRHRGLGSDGVLEPTEPEDADYGVRIWNPDGSVAEKSGNGLRIYARWLMDRRGAPDRFTVWTGSSTVGCELVESGIAVEMGRAVFGADEVPFHASRLPDGFEGIPVSVGNPHCVLFRDDELDELPWREWGEGLEVHPAFPGRTNVQIARVRGRSRVEARIWERGAGPTEASGSSACAVAAAGVHTERLDAGRIEVVMPGGTLHVTVRAGMELRLVGPVEVIGAIELDERWLAARRGGRDGGGPGV